MEMMMNWTRFRLNPRPRQNRLMQPFLQNWRRPRRRHNPQRQKKSLL